jgi:hypothetical protein
MSLATKNGSIIVKDGKLAENCGCCGEWYCYKCEDGFAYDCMNFGTISINGNSTFQPRITLSTTSAGVDGCFEVQSGSLFQRISSTMCELWSISPGFDDCAKQYQQWSILPAGTDPRFMISGVEVPFSSFLPGGQLSIETKIQSRLTVEVSHHPVEVCGDVATKYRIYIGTQWALYNVAPSSSSNLWASALLVSESYAESRDISPASLSSDGTVTFSTGSLFASTQPRRTAGTFVPLGPIVSPRPPSIEILIKPVVFKAGCNNQ